MARRPPRTSGRAKLRWTRTGPTDARGCANAYGEGDRGEVYFISGSDDSWNASVRMPDGTTTVLASGVPFDQPYSICVRHYHGPLESLY